MSQGVILFPSIHFALRAEKIVQGKGIPYKLIPVPRHLSSDCGVCLRLAWEEAERVISLLSREGVKTEGVYLLSPKER